MDCADYWQLHVWMAKLVAWTLGDSTIEGNRCVVLNVEPMVTAERLGHLSGGAGNVAMNGNG